MRPTRVETHSGKARARRAASWARAPQASAAARSWSSWTPTADAAALPLGRWLCAPPSSASGNHPVLGAASFLATTQTSAAPPRSWSSWTPTADAAALPLGRFFELRQGALVHATRRQWRACTAVHATRRQWRRRSSDATPAGVQTRLVAHAAYRHAWSVRLAAHAWPLSRVSCADVSCLGLAMQNSATPTRSSPLLPLPPPLHPRKPQSLAPPLERPLCCLLAEHHATRRQCWLAQNKT